MSKPIKVIHEFINVSEKISRDVLALFNEVFMTVNWNPEDVQVSLTMDKGFKTVYSKNSINYPLMCSFLVMLAFHPVKYCTQCPIPRYSKLCW